MSLRIKDLPRFHDDCRDYEKRIASIENQNLRDQAQVMYETFLNAVDALDTSVENLAESGPVFGNEHQLLRDNLTRVRLDLARWLNRHSPMSKTNPIPVN